MLIIMMRAGEWEEKRGRDASKNGDAEWNIYREKKV